VTYAIPTKWNGVQFRSRLEARWAAFFTAIGWPWSYEPIDLQGYIPDFLLHLHEDVLVEVKPFTRFEDDVIADAHTKIRESGWGGGTPWREGEPSGSDAIVVGARIFDGPSDSFSFGALGWNDHAVLGICEQCLKPSFSSDVHSYHCRVCGLNTGNWPCFVGRIEARKRVFGAWNEAGNAVQWRRRK